MKRAILRWFWLPILVFFTACAPVKKGAKSLADLAMLPAVAADSRFDEATKYAWNECYGESAAPRVRFVSGDALDCVDPVSGNRGFICPGVGCRNGCTYIDSVVALNGGPPSGTSLAHELKHQSDTLHGILNPDHTGDFNAIVRDCNARLVDRGL